MKIKDIYVTSFLVAFVVVTPSVIVTFLVTDNPYATFFIGYIVATLVHAIVDAIKYPWEK